MTSEQIDSLVTPDMEERKGVWVDERVSPPVSESDIRRWAIASYWPEKPPPIFWDAEYARRTRWEGIIAPNDFNPFAWPIERTASSMRPAKRPPGQRSMNGGQVETFGVPIRPGDVITSRSRLEGWNERTTRLGLTLFQYTEMEWRNQRDELVKTRVSTSIRY